MVEVEVEKKKAKRKKKRTPRKTTLTDLTLLTPPPDACAALVETPSPLGALLPGAGTSEGEGGTGLLLLPLPFAVVALTGLSIENEGITDSAPIPLSAIAAGGLSGLCRGDASLMPSNASESRAVVERERAAGTPAEGGLEEPSVAASFDDLVGMGRGLLPGGGLFAAPVPFKLLLLLLSAIFSVSRRSRREERTRERQKKRADGRRGIPEENKTKQEQKQLFWA